jgi:hypothetical protein
LAITTRNRTTKIIQQTAALPRAQANPRKICPKVNLSNQAGYKKFSQCHSREGDDTGFRIIPLSPRLRRVTRKNVKNSRTAEFTANK